jgi:hypothetical protein
MAQVRETGAQQLQSTGTDVMTSSHIAGISQDIKVLKALYTHDLADVITSERSVPKPEQCESCER